MILGVFNISKTNLVPHKKHLIINKLTKYFSTETTENTPPIFRFSATSALLLHTQKSKKICSKQIHTSHFQRL